MLYKILFLFFTTFALYPHTLIFKDLKVIYGTVTTQDGRFVIFNTEHGGRKVRKDIVAKIIFQDVKDPEMLKKILKKVKETYPNFNPPTNPEPPPTVMLEDVEYESIKILIKELEEEDRIKLLQEKSSKAIARSFMYPGLGQYLIENQKTGYFYVGVFTALLLGSFYNHTKSVSEFQQYRQGVLDFQRVAIAYNPYLYDSRSMEVFTLALLNHSTGYKSYESYAQQRNQLAMGAVFVYAFQILHTFWDVKTIFSEKEKTGNIKIGFSLFPSTDISAIEKRINTNGIFFIEYKW